jgi:hypothetical protein
VTNPLNDVEFHQQALAGGASRHVGTGNVPDRGFMVGGARNLDNQPFPEIKHDVDSFSVDHVRQHARAIRDHFGEAPTNVHQGAWVEGKEVVLDASEAIDHYTDAITAAKLRGERAIYNVRRGRDHYVDDLEGRVKN